MSNAVPPTIQPRVPQLLEQRPEAITLKLEDLLAEAMRGRLRIPPFQRSFKWQRNDALKLLESIYLGYPIGTLLFWQTKAEAGESSFGSVVIMGAERNDAYWVVDGQQRVVSLMRTLLAPSATADKFALFFDLEETRIVPPPSSRRAPEASRYLPLTEVLDSERLMRWVYEHVRDQKDLVDKAFDLGKRVREYPIPAYIVRTDSDTPLREIFGRVNSLGKPMTANEVFDALTGVRSSDRPSSIGQIASELQSMHFGAVEQKILYRLLRVLQGADVIDRSGESPRRLEDAEAAALYSKTAATARRVVEFLENDAGIRHYALLPYKQPLVTLGKFFDLHPSPLARSRELLARWVWRGALGGIHRGDSVSTRRVLDKIDGDEAASVQRMLEETGTRPERLPDGRTPFNFRHAESKLEALALMDLEPRDLTSGAALSPADLFGAVTGEAEDALPKIAALPRVGSRDHHVSAANRLAHPARAGLRRALSETRDAAWLRSHGIDATAQQALISGDVSTFLGLRQLALAHHFKAFFERRARWDESDRPPIESLVVADEEA